MSPLIWAARILLESAQPLEQLSGDRGDLRRGFWQQGTG